MLVLSMSQAWAGDLMVTLNIAEKSGIGAEVGTVKSLRRLLG